MKKLNLNRVPKFVALIVLLFAFGIGNAWGGHSRHYFKGKAVAVNEGNGSGKVYVQQSSVTDVATISTGWDDEYETGTLSCKIGSADASSDNDHMFFCAKPDNAGSYFWGWYGEETCAEIMNDDPSLHQQILVLPTQQASTDASAPESYTLYAKFSDQPYPYHYYYGNLKAISSDGTKGRVQANLSTGDDGYGYWSRSNLAAEHTSPNKFRVKSDEASAADRIYATAVPMHGYVFTGWTPGANVAVADGFSADNWHGVFDVTTSSEDESSPFVGEVTANFIDASATSVTLLKDANRGTISVRHKYYYLNGSSVSEYSADLDAFALEEATHTYSTYTKSDVNYQIYPADRMTLTATPNGDYKFYGWYHEVGDRYEFLGDAASIEITLDENPNYFAYFDVVNADNAFMVGFYQFAEWEDALAAAKANAPCNMLLLKDYEISTPGYYTIPAGVKLIIPKGETQRTLETHPERVYNTYTYPTSYRKLTLGNGVKLDVFGIIQTGGTQAAKGQINTEANNGVNGTPTGTYGWLYMSAGSSITLEEGAHLYAWGYVTGARDEAGKYLCSIDARRGSFVHESFQIKDWRGGSCTGSMNNNSRKVFPLNQYYIQNIECPIIFRPGSRELCDGTVSAGSACRPFNDVNLIGINGSGSLFEMDEKDDSEDTWVKKWYDATNDKQVYDINSAASLGSITLSLYGYEFTSGEKYYLPITNNMKFHLLTGKLNVTENAELLPGAEIEIEKEATAYINSGVSLYLFNVQEWDKFNGTEHTRVLPYSPSWAGSGKTCPRSKVITEDAALTVHGTVEVNGSIHTTEHGANIFSEDADAGTIIYNTAAPATSPIIYVANNTGPTYNPKNAIPALLRNGDGSDCPTASTPAGQSYCYKNGKWTMMTVDPTNECFVYDNYGTYYAKPGAYVALANGKTANDDHTYSDADGRGRLYILMDECQWWEVENDNNLYKGITRDDNDVASWNGKYYEYNTSTGKWEEKRYTITWKDYDGTVITTYRLTYGTTPQYLSTNPTREANLDYTYDFTGWSPAFAPVTGDQIYTATYAETPVRYTITFKNSDGSIIERQFLTRGSNPTPPAEVTNGDKILQWNPSIGAVTGNQIYTAEWLDNTPATWTITWKNYDGSILDTTTPANEASEETVKAGAPTGMTKPATSEYTYTFDHWEPTIAAATSNATYTAIYTESRQTYAIRFFDKEGHQLGETQNLVLGADPVVPEYSQDPDAQYTYTLQWKIKDSEPEVIVGVSVPSVSGAVDYKGDFIATINRYTISAKSELEDETSTVGCTFTGAGTYNYGTDITLTAIPNTGYEFVKWKDNDSTDPAREISVSETTSTYTAIVKPAALEVNANETKVVTRPTNVSALVLHATPTSSSNLVGAENVSLTNPSDPVYFDLTRGEGKVFKHHTWYAFSVPFEVDPKEILFDGVTMQYNEESKKDAYEIRYYDGSERAANGKTANCWVLLEEASESNLVPGVFYMIANTKRDVTTIRFPKLADAELLTTSVEVYNYASETGSDADANWNGIANPALYHANMDVIGSAEHYAYTFNPDFEDPTNAYNRITLNTENVKLGTPFFVQAPEAKSVVVEPLPAGPSAAPRRAKAVASNDENIRFQVLIAKEDADASDDIVIRVDEEKEQDTYVLGKDLVRMGQSSINPQIWVSRYNEKLCVNVMPALNGKVNYPLGIFVPETGDYTLDVASQPIGEEAMLYLTKDGRVIWNLSYSSYTGTFEQGTSTNYALRIVVKKATEVATGIDEAVVDAHGETRKVLINNQVYIIRGDKAYTIDGQVVK